MGDSMVYGLQLGGPFHGLPCVKWDGAATAPFLVSQEEFMAKLDKGAELGGLSVGKRILSVFNMDGRAFDFVAPLFRLARAHNWFVVLEVPGWKLPAFASEANALVAIVDEQHPEWLRFPCAGVVSWGGNHEPKFDQSTAGIPKFLWGSTRTTADVARWVRTSAYQWVVQTVFQFPEVVL